MAEILARSTAEYTSIIGSAALLTFGSITPAAGTAVHVRAIWVLAAVQVRVRCALCAMKVPQWAEERATDLLCSTCRLCAQMHLNA